MVRDATDADFEQAVLERSHTVPVVVDFWATWCGPCRQLSPVIERVSAEHGGEIELVKVDVDVAQRTAASFGIQSIPTVVAFKDGRPIDAFIGAQPEALVRDFFGRLTPTEADRLAAQAETLGEDEAEKLYRDILAADPGHEAAITGLAAILASRGGSEEAGQARQLLARIPETDQTRRILAALDLASEGAGDLALLQEKVRADPNDGAARLELGAALAARGRYEEALEHLLAAVRNGERDEARRKMVDVFALLGEDHPLVVRYRRELASALF